MIPAPIHDELEQHMDQGHPQQVRDAMHPEELERSGHLATDRNYLEESQDTRERLEEDHRQLLQYEREQMRIMDDLIDAEEDMNEQELQDAFSQADRHGAHLPSPKPPQLAGHDT